MKTRDPSITGCHAMIEFRPPDQSSDAESGPNSAVAPLRPGFPPALDQFCPHAEAASAIDAPEKNSLISDVVGTNQPSDFLR
jgi:hypothetical protein